MNPSLRVLPQQEQQLWKLKRNSAVSKRRRGRSPKEVAEAAEMLKKLGAEQKYIV